MALTQNTYTGDGSTVLFSFTFPYLTTTDIKVSVNGVDTTAYSLANATTVQFSSAPANGAAIRIFRDTNVDALNAEFFSGSAIRASDLNNDFNQILYSTQETVNRRVNSTGGDMTGDLTMVNADIVFEGSTNDANETTLTVVDPTADRTITLPNVSGTVVTTGDTGTVSTGMVADSAITSAKIANGTIVDADIASNAELSVNKLQDGSARQLLQTSANGNDVEWASNIDIPGTLDVAGSTTLDSGVSVTGNITVSGTVDGRDVAADGTKLDTIESGATADQTNDEIRAAVEAATNSNVFTDADHAKLNAIEAGATTDQTATEIKSLYESNADTNVFEDSEKAKLLAIESGATADQTAAEIRTLVGNATNSNVYTDAHYNLVNGITATSAEINKLDGVTASTSELNVTDGITATTSEINILDGVTSNASELNTLDGITASTAELNQLDGKTISSTFTPANSNDIPTTAAINTYVSGLLNSLGGFVAIPNKNSFPTTNPDPSDNAGTIVSIANAGGMSINGSGVGTGQTTAGTAVTITGFPSTFNSTTIQDGLGLQVQTTNTLNTYTYHKVYAKDEDVRQLSQDVNDFKARYRVGASNPTTDLDSGDLFFNTGSGKMLVYNGQNSDWEEVQSIGEFFINTLSSSSGTGGGSATFNGSAYRFTISNAPTNAQQLLISVNGVVQKPNSGTSQPSEGFALDGSDIIFSAAPATNSPFFVITIGSSVNIGTPSAGTVGTAQLATSAVTNDKVSSSAAIASSKLAKPIDFADNEKARFGTGNDLEIYHDGSDSRIDNNIGSIILRNLANDQDIILETDNGSGGSIGYIVCDGSNGKVLLYHYGTEKLATKSDGILVSGEVQCDSLDVDGNAVFDGYGQFGSEVSVNRTVGTYNTFIGQLNGTTTFEVEASGTATFAGSVEVNDVTLSANDKAGISLGAGGGVIVQKTAADTDANVFRYYKGNQQKIQFGNDGSATFGGNVGIGISDPGSKLEVKGFGDLSGTPYKYAYSTDASIKVTGTESTVDIVSSDAGNHAGSLIIRGLNKGYAFSNDSEDDLFRLTSFTASADDWNVHESSGSNVSSFARLVSFRKSGGMCFGNDTGAGNALDDYEEGQWTPTLQFGGSSTGISYGGNRGGSYVKIGRMVFIHCRMELTDKGSLSGDATIHGLPFTQGNIQSGTSAIETVTHLGGYQQNVFSTTLSNVSVAGSISENTTTITLRFLNYASGDHVNINAGHFEDNSSFAMDFIIQT